MKELEGLIAATGSKKNKLAIQLNEFDGRRLLNIRYWFIRNETGEWSPTKKGISLSNDKFDFVFRALVQNEAELREWLSDDNQVLDSVKRDHTASVACRDEIGFGAKPYVCEHEPWKSPEFFRLEGLGGTDRLLLNAKHPIAECASREQEAATIEALLVSFGRAMRLFSDEALYTPEEFLDLLVSNWGLILDRYLQES